MGWLASSVARDANCLFVVVAFFLSNANPQYLFVCLCVFALAQAAHKFETLRKKFMGKVYFFLCSTHLTGWYGGATCPASDMSSMLNIIRISSWLERLSSLRIRKDGGKFVTHSIGSASLELIASPANSLEFEAWAWLVLDWLGTHCRSWIVRDFSYTGKFGVKS